MFISLPPQWQICNELAGTVLSTLKFVVKLNDLDDLIGILLAYTAKINILDIYIKRLLLGFKIINEYCMKLIFMLCGFRPKATVYGSISIYFLSTYITFYM